MRNIIIVRRGTEAAKAQPDLFGADAAGHGGRLVKKTITDSAGRTSVHWVLPPGTSALHHDPKSPHHGAMVTVAGYNPARGQHFVDVSGGGRIFTDAKSLRPMDAGPREDDRPNKITIRGKKKPAHCSSCKGKIPKKDEHASGGRCGACVRTVDWTDTNSGSPTFASMFG